MADEVSPGEVYRRLLDHEARTDRVHAALDSRLADMAKDMVPLTLYQQGERDRDREIQRLDEEHDENFRQVRSEIKELRERPQMTVTRWVGVATAAIMLVALLVQAYGTLKGAGGK